MRYQDSSALYGTQKMRNSGDRTGNDQVYDMMEEANELSERDEFDQRALMEY